MTHESFRTPVSEHLLFKGRPGDLRIGEWVKRSGTSLPSPLPRREVIVLWGCPDDTGVVLNRGRAGAKEGPDAIRKHLYRMTPPMEAPWDEVIDLYDYGNLVPASDIVETHGRCREAAAAIARADATIIALGGGHDFAAPNFLGFAEGRIAGSAAHKPSPTFSLINVDPHLDVRELEEERPHSGTPFRQILESGLLEGRRFTEFGARGNRNARHHYQYCLDRRVTVLSLEEIRDGKPDAPAQYEKQLTRLAARSQFAGATFDMDACADAEGVSAAPVLGFSALEMCAMAELAGDEKKVRFLEIAEVAPSLDFNERSARIAAEMIYFFLRARARRLTRKA